MLDNALKLRMILRISTPILALVAQPLAALAQDHPVDLGTILLNTERREATLLDVPANTTVISEDVIEERHIHDLGSLTRAIPGITASRQTSSTDPFSTYGGVSIRGVGGNRVQLQVDGSRMAERIVDGTRDYFDFNFTKQVEVVRGPASILWGADALGGVLSLQTIDPEDVLEGRDRAGSISLGTDTLDRSTTGAVTFAQKLSPDLDVMLGYSRESSHETRFRKARSADGIYGCPRNVDWGATPCNRLDPASRDSQRLLAKLVWTPNDQHQLKFTADILRRETDVQSNNSLGPVYSSVTGLPTGEINRNYDRNLDLTRKRFAIEHVWTRPGGFLDTLQTTLAYVPHAYSRTGLKTSTSAAGDNIITRDRLDYAEDFVELDIQGTSEFVTGHVQHSLIFGFDGDYAKTDYSRSDLVRNVTQGTVTENRAGGFNFANADTRRADIYIQDRITLDGGRFELTPGLRYATYKIDPRPDADYQVVPGSEPRVRSNRELLKSLGAIYRLDDTYSVWAKYGEGFKMPTAQQLFTSLPGSSFDLVPAPNLRPEKVKSVELGVRGEYDRGYFAANVFKARYSDFIEDFYNPPGTSDYTYRNISEVDVWGVELSGTWEFNDGLSGTIAAAWQKGRQRAEPGAPETPHTVPPLTASVSLAQEFPQHDLRIEAVGTFASRVRETASPSNFKPAGYAVLDLNAQWGVTDSASLNFSLSNVFNRRYFTAGAASYGATASDAVARANPIELQTGPGREFAVSFDVKF